MYINVGVNGELIAQLFTCSNMSVMCLQPHKSTNCCIFSAILFSFVPCMYKIFVRFFFVPHAQSEFLFI